MFYLDTSFITPLILPEDTSAKIEKFLGTLHCQKLVVSHWTRVEFGSLVSRRVRMRELRDEHALKAIDTFENLIRESFFILVPTANDYNEALNMLCHFTALRSGDALHLSIVKNNNVKTFYTLDKELLKVAHHFQINATSGINQ